MNNKKDDIQYDIVKSEACGHTIEYKRLAKNNKTWGQNFANLVNPSGTPVKKDPNKSLTTDHGRKWRQTMPEGSHKVPTSQRPSQYQPKWEIKKGLSQEEKDKLDEKELEINRKKVKEDLEWEKNPQYPDAKDLEYPSKKSESGMYTVEYKRLAKQFGAPAMPPMGGGAPMAATPGPAAGPAGAAPMMMNEDKEEECKCKGEKDCECEKESPKDDLEKNTDQKVKETKGIDHDKEHDSDKTKEEKKKIKRPLEKCGDLEAAKKSERFYVKEIQRLRKKEMTELKKQSAVDLYMGGKPTKKQLMNRGVRSLKEKAQNFAQNRAKKAAQKAAEKKFAERLARGGSIERVAGKAGRGAKFLRGAGKVAAPLTAGLAAADATKRAYQMATGDSGKLDKELMDKYKRNVSEGNYLDMALDPVDTAIGGLSTGAKKAMDYFDVGGDKEAQRIMAEADKKAAAKKQARAGITQKNKPASARAELPSGTKTIESDNPFPNSIQDTKPGARQKQEAAAQKPGAGLGELRTFENKQAAKPERMSFGKDTKFKDAFNQARAAGETEFDWGGKPFHTYTKKEFGSGKTMAEGREKGYKGAGQDLTSGNKYYNAWNKRQAAAPAAKTTAPAARATAPAGIRDESGGPGRGVVESGQVSQREFDAGRALNRNPAFRTATQRITQDAERPLARSEENSAQKLRKFMEKDSKKLEK